LGVQQITQAGAYRRASRKAIGLVAEILAAPYGTPRPALLYYCGIASNRRNPHGCNSEDNAMAKTTPSTAAAPKKSPAKPTAAKTAAKPKAAKPAAKAAAASEKPVRDQIAATRDTIKAEASRRAKQLREEAATLADTASTKARDAAGKGKDKAAEAVGTLAKMLEDSAATVDSKFGKQYGDYARSAATTVAGLATTLEEKDLDELAQSTRDFVKKSPAVAVGAAAVIGFVLARMLKGSGSDKA
jgi:ElaB/YqjD/DUF883 family membrane-anchored ribosome-binding protein